jgi:hypothetical protein
METRLGDCIEGHCSGIERRVVEIEQRVEEQFISLDMARAESEQGRSAMEKQFDDLKLEVHQMNRLLEHDNMVTSQGTSGLINNLETTSPGACGDRP